VSTPESLTRARERFRALSRAGLSFTDCTSVAVVERAEFAGIVSFNAGFDGVIERLGMGR
jgi:predicted nucleic acid-binding protein